MGWYFSVDEGVWFLHYRGQECLAEHVNGLRIREAIERRAGDMGVACCASGACFR